MSGVQGQSPWEGQVDPADPAARQIPPGVVKRAASAYGARLIRLGCAMITYFRHLFVDSWLGRAFALLIFVAFVAWGVSGVLGSMGRTGPGDVAQVGSQQVSEQEFDGAFQRDLQQVASQSNGGDTSQIPTEERGQIAMQALQGLVGRAEALRQASRRGIVVPDSVLRQAVFDAPLFKGTDGSFDRTRFNQFLAQRGMTETGLLSALRDDLAAKALIEPLRVGAFAPDILAREAFDYAAQTRTLDMVRVPLSAVPTPPPADDATLHRYFQNHPEQFQAPEFRRIKLVVLSPQTVARGMDVPEAQERALFKAEHGTGQVPQKRSVEVITSQTEARAEALATLWQGGAGWPQMQAAAADSVPVAIDDAAQSTFPEPKLGALAFGAKPDQVVGPTHLDSGWVLLKVIKVTAPTTQSFAELRPKLHDQIAASRASEGMADRVQKLQDAIAGSSGLDQIPGDIGAAALEGTLDASGMTQAGAPAPLPGSAALRRAVIAQAFAQKPGAPPELKQGPDDADYALTVQSVIPPQKLAYAAVAAKVAASVQHDAVRRAAEAQAARLFADARKRGGVDKLGRADVIHVGPIGRGAPPAGVPADLAQLAFSLAPGQSTMVETPDGFVVATVTGAQHPGPASNQLAFARMHSRLDQAVGDDIEASYAMALQRQTPPVLNDAAVRRVINP